MDIKLESGKPIYKQIVDQIILQIKDGILRPGDRLPTERELSQRLEVARGTVQKAYRELSDNNIIEMIQGSGSYIYNDKSMYDAEQRRLALELINSTLSKLESWGFSPEEVSLLFRMSIAGRTPASGLVKVALVDCNPESLAIFRRQFKYIPGIVTYPFLIDTIIMEKGIPELLTSCDLVLTTVTHYEQLEKSLRPLGIKPVAVDVAPSRQTIVSISALPSDCSVGIICQSNKFANLITQQYCLFKGVNISLPIYFETDIQQSLRFMEKFDAVIVSPDLPLLDSSISGNALEQYLEKGKKIIPFDYMIVRGSMIHVEEMIDRCFENKNI